MRISRPFHWGMLLVIGLALLALTVVLLLAQSKTAPGGDGPAVAVGPGSATATVGDGAAPPSLVPSMPSVTEMPTRAVGEPAPTVAPSSQPTLAPSATLVPTQALAASLAAPGWDRIRIDDPGIAFDAPAAWTRAGEDWIWKPDPAAPLRVGLSWLVISDSAWQPADMLPEEAEVLNVTPVKLGWASGQSFRIKIQAGDRLLAVEQHIVATVNDEIAYDFFASAPTLADLTLLEPVWQQMTGSVTLEVDPGGPIDVTVQLLAAVARGEPVDRYLTARQQGRAPLELLNLPGLYSRFNVSWQGEQEGQVLLQALFTYTDREVSRTLVLVWRDEHWLVDSVQ